MDRLPHIIGTISTELRTARPRGAGWERDPKTGLYVMRGISKNMIVSAGLSAMFKWIQYGHANAGGTIRYIEVGTGYTAPAKAQTALVSATLRVAIDSWDNSNIDSDPAVMIASRLFTTSQANASLMECGLFQNSTSTPMFCRGLFENGAITGATKADPVVITSAGHGLTDGKKVLIEAVGGMTELNGNQYFVDQLSSSTFALYTDAALTASLNGTGFTDYTSGGTFKRVIPKTSDDTLTITYSLSAAAA